MKEEIFTFEETLEYLKIKRSFLYRLLETGRIPASKVGKIWRIRKSKLDNWLDEREVNYNRKK